MRNNQLLILAISEGGMSFQM